MRTVIFIFASLLLATLFPRPAHAKVFRNAYVSFELGDAWNCELSGTEWVCRNVNNAQTSKEAVIILTAKEVGPADSLQAYEAHIKTPRMIANRQGKPQQSTIYKVQQRNIANHPWVDGMHLGSEIPNYYTRYLATVKDRIAVLVTFSAHKLHYTKYVNDFFRAIESLRIVAAQQGNMQAGGGAVTPGADTLGPSSNVDVTPTDMGSDGFEEDAGRRSSSPSKGDIVLGLALVIGAVGAYLMFKKKK